MSGWKATMKSTFAWIGGFQAASQDSHPLKGEEYLSSVWLECYRLFPDNWTIKEIMPLKAHPYYEQAQFYAKLTWLASFNLHSTERGTCTPIPILKISNIWHKWLIWGDREDLSDQICAIRIQHWMCHHTEPWDVWAEFCVFKVTSLKPAKKKKKRN